MSEKHRYLAITREPRFVDINDDRNGGSDFTKVRLEVVLTGKRCGILGSHGYILLPVCKDHGSMNRVSPDLWRCLHDNCRAGCKEVAVATKNFFQTGDK